MNARITDIKRFAVHDGDGIRTTVFFKGCSLSCIWCHNPETISTKRQLGFYEHKCILCGECADICECHTISANKHTFSREHCNVCGRCAKYCPSESLITYGKNVSIDKICKTLVGDKDFYSASNGGITLSGGECLLQSEACKAILLNMKENNIHTAVDTCGYVNRRAFDNVIPYTDIFLYDIKAYDENVHIKCTGHSNKLILENLKYLNYCGKKIEIRIPFAPEYNSSQIEKISKLLYGMENITKIRILPLHNYAGSKYSALNMKNRTPSKMPSAEEIESAKNIVLSYGMVCE